MSDDEQQFQGDSRQGLAYLLKRLYQNSRATFTQHIAHRATSTFTLQGDAPPPQAVCNVGMLVYPQNPLIDEPQVRYLNVDDVQSGLVNSRFRVEDSSGRTVQPDEDGNYFFEADTPEFAMVNAFYYATFTLRMFERYAGRTIAWAFPSPRLMIDAHAGTLANAFYNEQARMIGFHKYTNTAGKHVSTAENADVVTHETAHAVLDGLRDLWNESFGLGCRAFHEAFGDLAAVLVALHDDSLIRQLLSWTDNNLRVSNVVSEVAEHLVQALQSGEVSQPEHTIYLRNALNKLKAQPFDALSYVADDPEITLSRQEHNYSRLFTGACYDVLVGIYELYCQANSPYVAVIKARDTLGSMLTLAIELAPVGEMTFADMARAFLTADRVAHKGEFAAILTDVFIERGILTAEEVQEHAQAEQALPDVRLPKVLNNALASAQFLEAVVLPALGIAPSEELMPLGTHRNADGYAFLTYYSVRSTELNDSIYRNFDGAVIDLFGGLTLGFDPQDRLCSVVYRPVTDEDVRQVRIVIAELIRYNRVATSLYLAHEAPSPSPKGLYVRPLPQVESARIVKYPVVYDVIPDKMSRFLDYLKRWQLPKP